MTESKLPESASPKVETLLDEVELSQQLDSLSCEELSTAAQHLWHYLYLWMIIPPKESLRKLAEDAPALQKVLPLDRLADRLDSLGLAGSTRLKVTAENVLPELPRALDLITQRIESLPASIEKTEAWLKPIATSAGADGDIEAAVYFASRGRGQFLDAGHLREVWHRSVCQDIDSESPSWRSVSEEARKRAREGTLSLAEAADLLDPRIYPRFFPADLAEEDFVDAALFRAVEWIGIVGFDPWLRALAAEMSRGPQGGIEHSEAGWTLFHWARSDLALNLVDHAAWETWLYTLSVGPVDPAKPWRQRHDEGKGLDDYIPLAAIILFLWRRISPRGLKDDVLQGARELLAGTQMASGAWPISSKDSRPCLLATCTAIHALALDKPNGWEMMVQRAADWLMSVQDPMGFWSIGGGPTTMLTVLALDSIQLARGGAQLTFRQQEVGHLGVVSKDEMAAVGPLTEPVYDYTKMEWHSPSFPGVRSLPLEDAHEKLQPALGIVAATEVEFRQVLRLFIPADGEEVLLRVFDGPSIYYLGIFGAFPAVLTMSAMGAQGPTGSTLTTSAMIQTWDPTAVLLAGVAFGRSRNEHQAGDVLVADRVINYEPQRIGDEKTVNRGQFASGSPALVGRFRNALDWRFDRPDGTQCRFHIGPVLSGEKLVDNEEFKRTLLDAHPTAIGGEMEGTGLWSAAEAKRAHWILVKGVCDWADGHKHDDLQEMAAASACSLCHHVFSDARALDGL